MDLNRLRQLSGIQLNENENKPFDKEIDVADSGIGDIHKHAPKYYATFDDYDGAPDSNHPIGHGRTPLEALLDLRNTVIDNDLWPEYSMDSMKAAFAKKAKELNKMNEGVDFDDEQLNESPPPEGIPKELHAGWNKLHPRKQNEILMNVLIGKMKQAVDNNNRMAAETDKLLKSSDRGNTGVRKGERS